MKFLLTGGLGFLGAHLTKRLIAENHLVTIFDNRRRNSIQYIMSNYEQSISFGNLSLNIINGDIIKEKERIRELLFFSNFDVVVHLAAVAGVSAYYKVPVETLVTNGVGTANVLEACNQLHRNRRLQKVIIVSSSEVYGNNSNNCLEYGPVSFNNPNDMRLSYAVGKLFGDHLATAYYKEYGLPICIIRPFGVYGPAQTGEGAIQVFCRKATRDEPLPVIGRGTQTRSWCYISDFIDAIMECIQNEKATSGIFNISAEDSFCSIFDLAQKIIKLSNSKSIIKFMKRNVSEIQDRKCDMTMAKNVLGFKNKISFDDGLLKTIKWYKENNVGEDISF